MSEIRVGIIVGSASDLNHAEHASAILRELEIGHEVCVASAHRTPRDVVRYAETARDRGLVCIIAMAGMSAALPGVVAANTTLPVLGVPIASPHLGGLDALLSIVQMPSGVPVGSMGIDGAKNAALMAARIIASSDDAVSERVAVWSRRAAEAARESRGKVSEKGMPEFSFSSLDVTEEDE